MRFEDRTQNLSARLRIVQIVVLAFLCVCVLRLYNLQIIHGEYYRERAINQRLRTLPISAPRGSILDRHARVLVDSPPIYNVVLQREIGRTIDVDTLSIELPRVLDIDPDYLQERFAELRTNPAYESILIKENATMGDIAWVEAHTLEFPSLQIEQRPQRRYPENGLLAHVLGYVGEISLKQLELPEYAHNYKPGDVIGTEGLEATYDQLLRGREGSRRVIVDSLGRIKVVGLGKDVGKNQDHSWFVSYAPAFEPEIAVLALIENSGFGSRHAAPAARAIYDVYFEKSAGAKEGPEQIAQAPKQLD